MVAFMFINGIKKEFSNNSDLVIKKINISIFNTIYIIYLESVSSSDKVNEYILKTIVNNLNKVDKHNIKNYIASPNTIDIKNKDECEYYLTNGFTIIYYNKLLLAIETKADLTRAISDAKVESSINGPKDSFTENSEINLGLIKRRLKTSKLKSKNLKLGRKTNTDVNILYLDDISNMDLVNKISDKLSKIDIDGIIDSSTISYFLEGDKNNVYPTILETERPDVVVTNMLQGKVAIMVDTSPFVLIAPSFFIDFINPVIDNYNKSGNVNFIKLLRTLAFLISMMAPALYVAIMNYNQETIPTSLLIKFATERSGVPFPTIVETIIMLIVCEILRESDLRFPSSYGSAISILGAIVLGEVSVSAGIASPITIIVIAITFISSLTFTTIEINNVLRYFRFIFLFSAGFFGLYGITLALFYFLIYTTKITSLDYPYFFPISPFDKTYFKNTVLKTNTINDTKRSSMLTNNIIKKRFK